MSPTVDQFVVTYSNLTTTDAELVVGTISGTTITIGSVVAYAANTSVPENNAIVEVDSTHGVWALSDTDNGGRGDSVLVTMDFSDRSATLGDVINFEAGDTGGGLDMGLEIALIDTNKIVICYQDDDDSDDPQCVVGEIIISDAPSAVRSTPILNAGSIILNAGTIINN